MSQEQTSITPVVDIINDRPATTSLKIAECFEKRHDHVLRDIQTLIAQCPHEFNAPNFGAVEYKDAKGEKRPMYTVYFDGFILLVMGYTGPKALKMKLTYIKAFNAMKAKLEAARKPELTQADEHITPDQQCTLRAIVKAKIGEETNKGRLMRLYGQIWSRFNNHFRIARYCQLPQSRMSEAVDYLMRFEIMPRPLPPNGKDSLPGASDTFPADMIKDRAEALRRIRRLSEEARVGFGIVRNIVNVNCGACGISTRATQAEHDICDVIDGLQATASASLAAAFNALESAYRIGRAWGRG